jgi:hypothetical protein
LTNTGFGKWPFTAALAFAIGLGVAPQSFAACGGYCEARQVRAICHRVLATQDLEASERDTEFEKCKSDPEAYTQPVRGGAEFGLD